MTIQQTKTPIYILAGFLGSGKTTLLNRAIDFYNEQQLKAAIVMNELGEINLDSQLMNSQVPTAEMLGGCICCSISSDLSSELHALIHDHHPDVIVIETTGAANPMELIDAVTETALYTPIELRAIVTVVDGPELLRRQRRGGRTFKLMRDQIRCATELVLNKTDLLAADELVEVQQLVREWNVHAPLHVTTRCAAPLTVFDLQSQRRVEHEPTSTAHHGPDCSCGAHHTEHESHAHVMALTHYLSHPVDSYKFEALLKELPDNVYRAKGIVTFAETNSRYLFQYAYRETEFIRITPQAEVHDVAVFIGEHFDREQLLHALKNA